MFSVIYSHVLFPEFPDYIYKMCSCVQGLLLGPLWACHAGIGLDQPFGPRLLLDCALISFGSHPWLCLVLLVADTMRRPVFVVVAVTLMLAAGPYNGSTLVVAGRDDTSQPVRELAVVGGTGALRRAAGHVLWSTARVESSLHAVLQLDVHASVPAPPSRQPRRAPSPAARCRRGRPPRACSRCRTPRRE